MFRNSRFIFLGMAVTVLSPYSYSQEVLSHCINSQIEPSTPTDRFKAIDINGVPVVRDLTTKLEWQNCLSGQQWDGVSSCVGEIGKYTWSEALAVSQNDEGWRVPNINELASLIERCSRYPALNTMVFPGIPGGVLVWSSTPAAGAPSSSWILHSGTGAPYTLVRSAAAAAVLLVREQQDESQPDEQSGDRI